ncbi:hypothetical protein C5167_016194 [Papaver somniferum]|nr:hypothetical protein C5167_016194 [Papaver somniferum]
MQKVRKGKKNATPPSRPPRVGDKLLTAIYRGEHVVPGMLRIFEREKTHPPEPSDSDETPIEDQSIPSGRRGNDDDDQGNPPTRGGRGIYILYEDIKSCPYEDVHVMWSILVESSTPKE